MRANYGSYLFAKFTRSFMKGVVIMLIGAILILAYTLVAISTKEESKVVEEK